MKRRVFVTGGAHGIGKGIVEAFARQGEEVVFCDLDPVLGAQTVAETGARFCQLVGTVMTLQTVPHSVL